MKKIIYIFATLLLLMSKNIKGQTVALPDTNLRNALLAKYPSVMQGNELNILNAAALTGALDLHNSNIYDATGIEHFTGIVTLNLSNNKLETIPDISGVTGLKNFYASDNNLKSFPDISGLTQLTDFQVMRNKLTALPDLTNSTGLKSLYCSSNMISEIPDLSVFPDITFLVIGDNPLKQPIDFSSCINLVSLHIHKTNADTIIGLEKLTKLKILYTWGNSISDLSGLNSNTILEKCFSFGNNLKDLSFLNNKLLLNELDVNSNYLTFEDILPVYRAFPTSGFNLHPQKTLNIFKDKTVRAESTFNLKYPEALPETNNIYVWQKDGKILDSSSSPTYKISPVSFSDSGIYKLRIYNSTLPDLILESNSFQLTVAPCIEFKIPFAHIIEKECSAGYTIDLSNALVAGGTRPFTYELNTGAKIEKYSEEIIKNIPAGKYYVSIIDANKCKSTDSIVLDRIEKCDPVITPNGDGISDTYFIEETGTAKIYDLRRKLIKTLSAPATWDGTNHSGALLDAGFYIIILNDKTPIYITLIR